MCNNSQLQLHYTILQLRLHNTTLHPAVVGDVKDQIATATIATSPKKKHSSNHLSVNQWIRCAIRASQQPTSAIGFLFWNFLRGLVRYYWNRLKLHITCICVCFYIYIYDPGCNFLYRIGGVGAPKTFDSVETSCTPTFLQNQRPWAGKHPKIINFGHIWTIS